jgi:hypothetical protein
MTDSIKIKLDLYNVPKADMRHVPVPIVLRRDRTKPTAPVVPFAAYQSWISPLTRNPMKVKVLVTPVAFDPAALVADINIPNATIGQNAELGHSVYAASTVALELFKAFLAEHRVPLESLDLLTVEHLGLGSVTITYLIPAPADHHNAQACIEAIEHRYTHFFPQSDYKNKDGKKRYGGGGEGSKGSRTAYCIQRGWSVRVYSTPAHKIPGDDGPVRDDRIKFAQSMIRIELTLTFEELREYGLQNVKAWQNAHADGIYKILFDTYVRQKSLRLHERLRTDRPDATDIAKLGATNRHIVEGYLAGKPMDKCELLQRPTKLATQQTRSRLRGAILKLLRLDINVEWPDHHKFWPWLDKVIVYAGDHNPPADRAADSFCRDSHLSIIERARTAVVKAASRLTGGGGTSGNMQQPRRRYGGDPADDEAA